MANASDPRPAPSDLSALVAYIQSLLTSERPNERTREDSADGAGGERAT